MELKGSSTVMAAVRVKAYSIMSDGSGPMELKGSPMVMAAVRPHGAKRFLHGNGCGEGLRQ